MIGYTRLCLSSLVAKLPKPYFAVSLSHPRQLFNVTATTRSPVIFKAGRELYPVKNIDDGASLDFSALYFPTRIKSTSLS